MRYNGIDLTQPKGLVSMSHSHSLDLILGKSTTENMDWTDAFLGLPWSMLKTKFPDGFACASQLSSLLNMNYQVCNGGIGQYFFNRYNEARDPYHEDDVAHYDLDEQKKEFWEVVQFAKNIYPDRPNENAALTAAATAFQDLWFEEDALVSEEVYCDEDRYIWDDELGEMVENPDYFESYEEETYEDIIHNDDNFNEIFYKANSYFEEVLEMYAQFRCKSLVREVEKTAEQYPEKMQTLREYLPAEAFSDKKAALQTQLEAVIKRALEEDTPTDHHTKGPDIQR